MGANNGDRPDRPISHSRIDSEYLQRRTEMFQNMRMEGYWQIGTGDREKVPKPKKAKAKAKTKPKGSR